MNTGPHQACRRRRRPIVTLSPAAATTPAACRRATRRSVRAATSTSNDGVQPSLLPEPTGRFSVGVRTVPSVSPDATTRVWYPARRGTGTGTPVYLAPQVAAAYGLPTTLLDASGATSVGQR